MIARAIKEWAFFAIVSPWKARAEKSRIAAWHDWLDTSGLHAAKLRKLAEIGRGMVGSNAGGEARLAAHQPSHTTTATPQGVASADQLGGRVRSEKD